MSGSLGRPAAEPTGQAPCRGARTGPPAATVPTQPPFRGSLTRPPAELAIARHLGWLSIALGACAYDPPVDDAAPRLLNGIQGDVVFGGGAVPTPSGAPATFVTLFDAASPPPPAGTGAPTTFAAVSPDAYTGGDATLRSAPWSLTRIPDGEWLLGAIADVDGDFQPFAPSLAGATCGDWGGAHLATLAGPPGEPQAFGPISVRGGEQVDDVTILIGQRYDLERPAFTVLGPKSISFEALTGAVPPTARLGAVQVDAAFSRDLALHLGPVCEPAELPGCEQFPACPCADVAPCGTALWVWMVDADADGVPDPYPGEAQAAAGLRDVWPRVYLVAEGEPYVDDDGVERVEDWVGQAHPLGLELLGTLAAGGDPATLGLVGTPFPAESLSITLTPTFLHHHAEGADGVDASGPFDVVDLRVPGAEVPAGAFTTTLISFTGQTWSVPNETAGTPALDPAFDPASQATAIVLGP